MSRKELLSSEHQPLIAAQVGAHRRRQTSRREMAMVFGEWLAIEDGAFELQEPATVCVRRLRHQSVNDFDKPARKRKQFGLDTRELGQRVGVPMGANESAPKRPRGAPEGEETTCSGYAHALAELRRQLADARTDHDVRLRGGAAGATF